MTSSINQRQSVNVILKQIDKQPTRLDMTFSESFELSL